MGNIAAGASGYANVSLTGTETTPEDSDGECTIIIKYENSSGESKTYKEKVNIYVGEEMEGMEGMGDMEDMSGEMTNKGGVPTAAKVIAVIVVLVAAGLVVRYILKKKRLKKEEELMDDELL